MTVTSAPTAQLVDSYLDLIYSQLDDLQQLIETASDFSWGTADDGSTSTPFPDGTVEKIRSKLFALSVGSMSICEYRKDLAQPGQP